MEGLVKGDGSGFHIAEQGCGLGLEGFLDDLIDALFFGRDGGFGFPVFGPFACGFAFGVFGGAFFRHHRFGDGFRADAFFIGNKLGDVGAVAPFFGHDHAPVFGVDAQFASALRGGKELFGDFKRELVGGH